MDVVENIEPSSFFAGDTVSWKITLTDYPSTHYSLHYTFYNENSRFNIQAQPQDDKSFLVEIPSSVSSQFTYGEYRFVAKVINNSTSEVITVRKGIINVFTTDEVSHIKKILSAIERAIQNRATRTDLEYSIGDKRIRHMTHEELYRAYKIYKSLYEQELQSEGIKRSTGNRNVKVRFIWKSLDLR